MPTRASQSQEGASSSGTSSGKSDKISGTIKKEIIDLLKQNGLPSDVDTLLNVADDFLKKSRFLHTTSIFGGDDEEYTLSDVIRIQQLVNRVKYNEGIKDKAIAQITSQASGSEIALTNSGRIYVYTEDENIDTITPSEYNKNKEKYNVLTNNQLLYLREHDSGLAFKADILHDLSNSVGMETITKEIREIINKFGSDKVEGYTTKSDSVNRGMEILMHAGPDGYYKFTDKNQIKDVNQAIHYLYNSLSNSAKNLLRAKSAVEGGDPNDINDISNLMYQALYAHTSLELGVQFDKSATEYDPQLSKKKGGSNTEQQTQNNYLQQIGNRRLYQTKATIVPKASKINETGAMRVPVYCAGAPVDKQNDVLGKMSLSEFRLRSQATKAGDMSSITFGNRLLVGNETDFIMYDGSSELNIAMLPYKRDPQTGQLTPDFSAIIKFNEIQKFLTDHPGASELELAQYANSKGIDWNSLNYNREKNEIKIKDTMPFITFSAYAGSDQFDISKEMKPFLEHLDGRLGKDVIASYNNMVKYGTPTPSKNDKPIRDLQGMMWWKGEERRDMYRGNVYIPMENAARAMLLSGIGEYVPKESMTDFAARVHAREQEALEQRILEEQDPNYDVISQNLGKFSNY